MIINIDCGLLLFAILVIYKRSFASLSSITHKTADVSSNSESIQHIMETARELRWGNAASIAKAYSFYDYIISNTTGKIQADAMYELYELYERYDSKLHEKYSPLDLLSRSADGGNSGAQHSLSAVFATGIFFSDYLLPMDSGRSITLEYMSALSGHPLANLGMGYRYLNGIGVVESCDHAINFYEFAANFVIEEVTNNNGNFASCDKMKLSDVLDPNAKWLKSEATSELTDYYSHLAEKGDPVAALTLGNIYYTGTRLIPQDIELAIYYLSLAAVGKYPSAAGQLGYLLLRDYHSRLLMNTTSSSSNKPSHYFWKPTKSVSSDVHPSILKTQNLNLKNNVTYIMELIQLARKKRDFSSTVALGYMHLHGLLDENGHRNYSKAEALFQEALGSHPDAGFFLGEMFMGQFPNHPIDFQAALRFYSVASHLGNSFAQHRIAHMMMRGMGTPRSCINAAYAFKAVAERGYWSLNLNKAHELFLDGRRKESLFLFSQLAAVGYEVAQYNAGYILSTLYCPRILSWSEARSLMPWSGSQSNPLDGSLLEDSRIKDSNRVAYLNPSKWKDLDDNAERFRSYQLHLQGVQENDSNVWSLSIREAIAGSAKAFNATLHRYVGNYLPKLSLNISSNSIFPSESERNASNFKMRSKTECESRSLLIFGLSAHQGNSESFLRIGDIYYYGRAGLSGPTDRNPLQLPMGSSQDSSKSEAAIYYKKAADLRHTHAIFNLGLMHEAGDGVPQDFHLAKRYYDQAAETDPKARTPRNIALFILETHRTAASILGSTLSDSVVELFITAIRDPDRLDPTSSYCPVVTIGWVLRSLMIFSSRIDEAIQYILDTVSSIVELWREKRVRFGQEHVSTNRFVLNWQHWYQRGFDTFYRFIMNGFTQNLFHKAKQLWDLYKMACKELWIGCLLPSLRAQMGFLKTFVPSSITVSLATVLRVMYRIEGWEMVSLFILSTVLFLALFAKNQRRAP